MSWKRRKQPAKARSSLGLTALAVLAAVGLGPWPAASQDDPTDPSAPEADKFTGARWSQIRPDRDFTGGCVVGFLAFKFEPTGHFVFNNHIHGAWRVDELGNLKLRTRDGVRFTLFVDGNTLRPSTDLPYLKRTYLYQRCPE